MDPIALLTVLSAEQPPFDLVLVEPDEVMEWHLFRQLLSLQVNLVNSLDLRPRAYDSSKLLRLMAHEH